MNPGPDPVRDLGVTAPPTVGGAPALDQTTAGGLDGPGRTVVARAREAPALDQTTAGGLEGLARTAVSAPLAGLPATTAPLSVIPRQIGRFIVLRQLGRGGMGSVFAAFDEQLGRRVAVKVLHRDLVLPDEGRAPLAAEARAMAKLSHPNVVQVYELGEDDGQLFLVMEYVEGSTLAGHLAARELPWDAVLRLFLAAGQGLAAAHRAGIVHRDFKPKTRCPSQTPSLPPFGRILANWGALRVGLCRVVPLQAAILATVWQRAARLCAPRPARAAVRTAMSVEVSEPTMTALQPLIDRWRTARRAPRRPGC